MKIKEAIIKAKKKKKRLKSNQCNMSQQDAKSLIYWLFEYGDSDYRKFTYEQIVKATDWELDN